jgi:hypothetical protein
MSEPEGKTRFTREELRAMLFPYRETSVQFFGTEDLDDVVAVISNDLPLSTDQQKRLIASLDTAEQHISCASLMMIHGLPEGRYERTGLDMLRSVFEKLHEGSRNNPEAVRTNIVSILDGLLEALSLTPGKEHLRGVLEAEKSRVVRLDQSMQDIMGRLAGGRPDFSGQSPA